MIMILAFFLVMLQFPKTLLKLMNDSYLNQVVFSIFGQFWALAKSIYSQYFLNTFSIIHKLFSKSNCLFNYQFMTFHQKGNSYSNFTDWIGRGSICFCTTCNSPFDELWLEGCHLGCCWTLPVVCYFWSFIEATYWRPLWRTSTPFFTQGRDGQQLPR